MKEDKKYLFEVKYLDSREGNMRTTEIEAFDESDAHEKAYEDYYFGKLISIDKMHEVF